MIIQRKTGIAFPGHLWGFMLCVALIMLMGSCKVEETVATEAVKKIAGSWHISKATRNGTDITEKFDFSEFNITFLEDGSYQLGKMLPFIVTASGTYTLDDPQYPYQILFKQETTDSTAHSSFDYPIVAGKRNLTITFSTGCPSNTYRYTLIKE